LTTIGPNTIGIGDDREDEQFKQNYDIITLFLSNREYLIRKSSLIKNKYIKVSKEECLMRKITYNNVLLYEDMINFIKKIQEIEKNDFIKLQMIFSHFI
jgi:hypothetical protein